MSQLLIHTRRHWQALLVLGFFVWRIWRSDFSSNTAMWLAGGFAIVGMAMNLVVILVNGGMPAQVTVDDIPDEQRSHYHPISPTTHVAWLSDWIPVGSLLISPGDVSLLVAVAILVVGAIFGF